MKVMFFFRYS